MTNYDREYWNGLASLAGAAAALCAAFMTGCKSLPFLNRVPSWDKCTLSSNWTGANAKTRIMNSLSPHMSEDEFKRRVAWVKDRGCNTMHLILCNQADGEFSRYCIYGSAFDWSIDKAYCDTFRRRIDYIRSKNLAVVIWLFTDDSSAWNREASKDFDRYLRDVKAEKLLDQASIVCVCLEIEDSFSSAQLAKLIAATRKVYSGKIGTHQVSGFGYAGMADYCFYQVQPGKSVAWLKAEARRVKNALGKTPLNFFEIERQENREKSQAVMDNGADACGNW